MVKTETTAVLLRLAPELLAALDEARGETPRSIYIRNRLGELIAGRKVVRAGLEDAHAKLAASIGYERPQSRADLSTIAYGPLKSPAGSRLKKPKAAK